jgi:hypothetical protein
MLALRTLAATPFLAPPPSELVPYEIEIDDDAEIDVVHLVILTPFRDATDA